MDPFLFCLILGIAGLAVMAISGVAAHGHDASHGHGGKDVGDVSLPGHGVKELGGVHVKDVGAVHVKDAGGIHVKDAGDVHVKDAGDVHGHDGGADGHDVGDAIGEYLLSLLSPRVAFSVLVGIGAAGLLLDPFLGGVLLLLAAVLAGVAFERLLVRPFWNFFFRFASTPAQTLETALMDRATAVTGFDAQGQGVVSIILDGQIVQLLGTLRPEDREQGVRVRAGDELLVEDVDGRRNRCVVSWLGAGAPADDGR
ncbi:MAG TPA: hypothetical protein VHG08_02980 [Longimicrobium sp.]|nr:hypothetical protein [Longimicrobium sp.]